MSFQQQWQLPTLTEKQFALFATFIYDACGIRLSGAKKSMLVSRLVSRLRALSMEDFQEYYAYVNSDIGRDEIPRMIDVVSTNKTDFFREDSHFSFLTGYIIPMLTKNQVTANNRLHIWSAGCSSGEEPYTMGMVLSEYGKNHPPFDFEIFATDISTRILDMARAGIYKDTKVAQVPVELVHRYLLRGRGNNKGSHRVVPELRRKINFQRVNFTDVTFPVKTLFDVIFCRNVIIYFDRKTQNNLFRKFYNHLKPGGYFFLGHSEMVANMDERFEKIEPTVYRKSGVLDTP